MESTHRITGSSFRAGIYFKQQLPVRAHRPFPRATRRIQGHRARYKGRRKNTLDVRRWAAVDNLQTLARMRRLRDPLPVQLSSLYLTPINQVTCNTRSSSLRPRVTPRIKTPREMSRPTTRVMASSGDPVN